MTKIIRSPDEGIINMSLVYSNGQVCALKCDACGKFIRKAWDKWYCPHCEISFLEGVSVEDMKGCEAIIDLIKMCENI